MNVKCLALEAFCFFWKYLLAMARPLLLDLVDAMNRRREDGGFFMCRFAALRRLMVPVILIFANSILLFGQSDSIYRLPVGTRISLMLDVEINSKISSVNDTFLATVTKPVKIRESVMLPVGTVIEGRVLLVERAGAAAHSGKLEVFFDSLRISDQTLRIDGSLVKAIPSESSKVFTALSIIGGLAAGTAIGAATNGGTGALIGAAIGGGTGAGIAMLKKGKDVRIRKDDEFEIELKKEVVLPVLDY